MAPYECDGCYSQFSTQNGRKNHSQAVHSDRYCNPCDRMFQNYNNLNQHLHSRIHASETILCPFCRRSFATAGGLTIHLESGRCSSGMDREQVNDLVRRLDRNHVITRPMLEDIVTTIATERSFNGYSYKCYFCSREYQTLRQLNKHLASPAHTQPLYHCPNRGCRKPFSHLSGVVQHLESESCGALRFDSIQKNAANGIHNMVGRLLR